MEWDDGKGQQKSNKSVQKLKCEFMEYRKNIVNK
jgi:hypothetical protein